MGYSKCLVVAAVAFSAIMPATTISNAVAAPNIHAMLLSPSALGPRWDDFVRGCDSTYTSIYRDDGAGSVGSVCAYRGPRWEVVAAVTEDLASWRSHGPPNSEWATYGSATPASSVVLHIKLARGTKLKADRSPTSEQSLHEAIDEAAFVKGNVFGTVLLIFPGAQQPADEVLASLVTKALGRLPR